MNTSAIERSTIVMNGRDCDVSTHDTIRVYCCHVMKSDWVFQLSGRESNSLNSLKLPGRFSLPKTAWERGYGPPRLTPIEHNWCMIVACNFTVLY